MTAADWINVALAFVITLMAGGTVYLAWYTRNLAEETAEGIEQAERQDLRPFCMIDFNYPTDQDPFGGELRNKGKGLAKDIVAYLNKQLGQGEEHAYRLTRPVVVSGLIGAEEAIKIDVPITERDVMQVRDAHLGWRPFETIPFVTYEVVLEYKDVFGNVFRTVHPRGLWLDQADVAVIGDDKAKQREMMTRHNKPTPVFLTGSRRCWAPTSEAEENQASLRRGQRARRAAFAPAGMAGFGAGRTRLSKGGVVFGGFGIAWLMRG